MQNTAAALSVENTAGSLAEPWRHGSGASALAPVRTDQRSVIYEHLGGQAGEEPQQQLLGVEVDQSSPSLSECVDFLRNVGRSLVQNFEIAGLK
jgi:hypothetical protein